MEPPSKLRPELFYFPKFIYSRGWIICKTSQYLSRVLNGRSEASRMIRIVTMVSNDVGSDAMLLWIPIIVLFVITVVGKIMGQLDPIVIVAILALSMLISMLIFGA